MPINYDSFYFQVEDVPIDVDTDDYKVDADEVVCFSGRQHYLSNLYPVSVLLSFYPWKM